MNKDVLQEKLENIKRFRKRAGINIFYGGEMFVSFYDIRNMGFEWEYDNDKDVYCLGVKETISVYVKSDEIKRISEHETIYIEKR